MFYLLAELSICAVKDAQKHVPETKTQMGCKDEKQIALTGRDEGEKGAACHQRHLKDD